MHVKGFVELKSKGFVELKSKIKTFIREDKHKSKKANDIN